MFSTLARLNISFRTVLSPFGTVLTQFLTHVHVSQRGVSPELERITIQTVHRTNSTLCRRASFSCGCATKHLRHLTPNSRQRQRPSRSNNSAIRSPQFGTFEGTNQHQQWPIFNLYSKCKVQSVCPLSRAKGGPSLPISCGLNGPFIYTCFHNSS